MQESHVVVSSSDFETFGITLIEAMACGKPVVATRSGGPEFFVDDKNGLLVPTGDRDALALALTRIRETHSSYDPESISKRCASRFGHDAILTRIERIYEELVGQEAGEVFESGAPQESS